MGIFTRPDSPYYWLYLEGAKKKEATSIPARTGDPKLDAANRRLAESSYHARMSELAHQKLAGLMPEPKRSSPPGWSYIYFLTDGVNVKIGRSVNLDRRLKELQVASPLRFQFMAAVPGHYGLEGQIQRAFRSKRIDREWFLLDDELRAFIDRVAKGTHPAVILAERSIPAQPC